MVVVAGRVRALRLLRAAGVWPARVLDIYQGPLGKAKAFASAACNDLGERDEVALLRKVRLTETRTH